MNAPPADDSTFAWDQYWRDGRLASCGGEGGAAYQPLIADGWRRFFGTVPEDARILDICCGNGAVARLAAEVAIASNLRVTIDAVDSADLHPDPAAGADMIRYSPRTPAEHLPFADGSFDAIVGQYGIEYTDLERTLDELRRVSQPDAKLRFVTHAVGSVVVKEAHRQLADAERLMRIGVFETAEALARAIGSDPPTANVDDVKNGFLAALQSLRAAETTAGDQRMYHNAGTVLVHALQHLPQVGQQPVLDKIAEIAGAIRAHHDRLDAMCRAALDAPRARALAAAAKLRWGKSFTLDSLTRSDGATFGWVIASTRAAAHG